MLAHQYVFWWAAQLVALAILVFLFLRWRPKFMGGRTVGETMGSALDARAEQIRVQLEAAQQSRDEAARIHEESQRQIESARVQNEEVLGRASKTSEAIVREMQERSRQEFDRIVGQAKVQIEYERERAELALRRRAADIVVDAAGQIVERHLEPATDRRLIVTSLDNLRELT